MFIPSRCAFSQPDPLAGKYPWLSPYAFCAADPINLTDPTGMNPVFDMNGNYLGSTQEGYTGLVYIYTGSETIDFSKYSLSDLLSSESDCCSFMSPMGSICLDPEANVNIVNHIISKFDGQTFNGFKFEVSNLDGGTVQYDPTIDGNWVTSFTKSNSIKPKIRFNQLTNDYELTVENISCSIILHEAISHGILHFCDADSNHWMSYLFTMCNVNLYPGTTAKYKQFYNQQLIELLNQ